MTSRRFAALGLLATACSTTTVATSADPRAHAWLAEHAGSEMQIETTDRGPDQRGVVLEAASPTQITFRTRADTVVPIDRASRLTVVGHGRGALDGALIGIAVGVLGGALYGATRGLDAYESSMDCTIVCNNSDAAEWGALMYGVLGVVLGTVTGAVGGHRDVLDLR